MIHHIVNRIAEAAKEGEAVTLTPEETAELAPFVQAAHKVIVITLEGAEFERKYRAEPPQIFVDRMEKATEELLVVGLGGEAGAKALAAELGLAL